MSELTQARSRIHASIVKSAFGGYHTAGHMNLTNSHRREAVRMQALSKVL